MPLTNAKTRAAATQPGALPLRRVALIGTVTGAGRPQAFLRVPGGRIQTKTIGDTLGNERVVAIDSGQIILAQADRTRALKMPGT